MTDLRPPRTVRDLEIVTGLSTPMVRAGIRMGTLPGNYVGRRYVIPADAFDAFCRGEWTPRPRSITAVEPVEPTTLVKRRKAS